MRFLRTEAVCSGDVLKSSRGRHAVFGDMRQTKREQRFIRRTNFIGTSFTDAPGKPEGWLKKQAASLYRSVGAYPTWPGPPEAGRLSELKRNGLSETAYILLPSTAIFPPARSLPPRRKASGRAGAGRDNGKIIPQARKKNGVCPSVCGIDTA